MKTHVLWRVVGINSTRSLRIVVAPCLRHFPMPRVDLTARAHFSTSSTLHSTITPIGMGGAMILLVAHHYQWASSLS